MKLLKLLTAVLAGMTLTIATVYTAQAGRVNHARATKQAKKALKKVAKKTATPNYAYTLTRGRGHVIKLTNTGRTENMYRVTVKEWNGVKWYYMALNPRQTRTIKKPRKLCVTVRRISKADEKRNADPRNHYTPLGIRSTEKTLWSRQN